MGTKRTNGLPEDAGEVTGPEKEECKSSSE